MMTADTEITDQFDGARIGETVPEDDLWFLPGPMEPADVPPRPGIAPRETAIIDGWRRANADHAARAAARIGARDDRQRRGPQGWRHRLALIEAADLS